MRAGLFCEFDEILPALGIVLGVPHDAMYFFGHIALEAAEAVAKDEGVHVIF